MLPVKYRLTVIPDFLLGLDSYILLKLISNQDKHDNTFRLTKITFIYHNIHISNPNKYANTFDLTKVTFIYHNIYISNPDKHDNTFGIIQMNMTAVLTKLLACPPIIAVLTTPTAFQSLPITFTLDAFLSWATGLSSLFRDFMTIFVTNSMPRLASIIGKKISEYVSLKFSKL